MNPMLLVVLAAAGGPPAPSPAPAPMIFHLAADLRRVPVGAWAEYRERGVRAPGGTLRWSLVERSGSRAVLEMAKTRRGPGGAPLRQVIKLHVSVDVDVDGDGGGNPVVRRLLVSQGARPPAEVPLAAGGRPGIDACVVRLDAAGGPRETVRLRSGAVTARVHELRAPDASTVRIWVDGRIGPMGILRMQLGAAPGSAGPSATYELGATGRGARSELAESDARPLRLSVGKPEATR